MIIKIPLGKTTINIDSLQIQIDSLKERDMGVTIMFP